MKGLRLTRRSGKATISCDLKSATTWYGVVGPYDYKAAEAIAVAWVDESKKGVRIGIEVVYDLEEEEEDQNEGRF